MNERETQPCATQMPSEGACLFMPAGPPWGGYKCLGKTYWSNVSEYALPQPATLNSSCMEGSEDTGPTNPGPINNPGEKPVQLARWGKGDGHYLFQNRRISLHAGTREDRSLEMIIMVTVATLPRPNLPNFNQHPPQTCILHHLLKNRPVRGLTPITQESSQDPMDKAGV